MHMKEKAEREEVRQQYKSRERTENNFKPKGAPNELRSRLADAACYRFENAEPDDDLENKLNENVDEISGSISRLTLVSGTMGTEINSQKRKMKGMPSKSDRLNKGFQS
ncbi:hypothetical protein PSTG_10083 [Puccinia striiformis f. sp. tritici PST-78]|uniref:t-SNARE coiled-coil homology domain-containing protein n=1 Tax=Puccinia striiformis f. sp. tritici PST-78 TaxID=1165861 RepID=A0A0L0VBN2_9BASI|nr:hypothetical protein PSTG_10083 [Puccinia striiformis f. sp. tritici PST-78]